MGGGCLTATSQSSWGPAGVPLQNTWVKQLYTDPVDTTLYVCATTQPVVLDGFFGYGMARLHQGAWDTVGVFDQDPNGVVRWGDSLLVCGSFSTANGQPVSKIAAWSGGQWHPFGVFRSAVGGLKVVDGELFAMGGFDYADGHFCNGLARRQGGEWVNVGNLEFESPQTNVLDIVRYQGEWVICGTITAPGSIGRDIMAYNGTDWYQLTIPNILGGFSVPMSMAVYQGDLYVTGGLAVAAGNAGNHIQRWDGATWHPVGSGPGLSYAPNEYTPVGGGYHLQVHQDRLFVSGAFWYAGNVPAEGIAAWDGSRWCGLGGSLPPQSTSFAWLGDTLYAACGSQYIDGSYVNFVAKYLGGTAYADTCSAPVGVMEGLVPSAEFSVVVEADGQMRVRGWSSGAQAYRIYDTVGRVLLEGTASVVAGEPASIQTVRLPPGVYMLSDAERAVRFVMP